MSAQVTSYPSAPFAGVPSYNQLPQPTTCQCPECLAWLAAQRPRYVPQNTYTHSPYSLPIVQETHQGAAPMVNVVVRKRTPSISETSSHSSSEHPITPYQEKVTTEPSSHSKRNQPVGQVNIPAIQRTAGRVLSVASTPHGSSFLQSALHQYPIEGFEIVAPEIEPVLAKAFQDKHACYVAKLLLEMMDKPRAYQWLQPICANEDLLVTLCTKDLHSRRMIQFLLDFLGAENCRFLFDLVMRRSLQVVRTQQGCITLQRILDHFGAQEKETFFDVVRSSFMEYALDPFGNYIVQYMLTEGNQVENSNTLALYCRGQLHNMVCHKYASNVIEKCFGLVTPELQHDIIEELFVAPEFALMRVLTDSSANYVVQAAIRAASYRDVTLINDRLSPLLAQVPYGKKLQKRLDRRLNH